jgi:carboxymethylenebutenolidase
MSAGAWQAAATDAGGLIDVWLHAPPCPSPAIVLLQEIFGVNAAMRACAAELASAGFAVAAPDLFHRLAPRVDLGYSDEERARAFDLWKRFDAAQGAADAAAVAGWLAAQPGCDGRLAYVGFCLGGNLAVKAAALAPAPLVSFYGVKLEEEAAAIEQLARAGTPMQFHFGTEDAHVPATAVATVRAALSGWNRAEVHVYPGAGHGFFNAARAGVFHAQAAAEARRRMLGFLGHAPE